MYIQVYTRHKRSKVSGEMDQWVVVMVKSIRNGRRHCERVDSAGTGRFAGPESHAAPWCVETGDMGGASRLAFLFPLLVMFATGVASLIWMGMNCRRGSR